MSNSVYNRKERYEELKKTSSKVVQYIEEQEIIVFPNELEDFLEMIKIEINFKNRRN